MSKDEAEDIKRHFDIVAESLRDEIRLVADGVAMNSERLDRVDGRLDRVDGRLDRVEGELVSFRVEVRREFAEVRSAIKLSYAELDGRLTKLETSHANLQSRIERLEAKLAS
jgi:chromosome segregation ATPase